MSEKIEKLKLFFISKLRTFQEILEFIKELGKEETREMIALILLETFRFLKRCRIRKAEGILYFAMEDPSTMGQVLEGIALLYPFIQDKIQIVPEFGDNYYYGELYLEGRIRLLHLLILLFRLFRHKEFRKLVLKGGKHGK